MSKGICDCTANTQFVWLDRKFVKYSEARVPLLTHSLQYGSGVFEGIRCYNTARGPAIFRLRDHALRLFDSAKIYGMPIKYSLKDIEEATKQLIKKNRLASAYIRPFIFYNYVGIGYRVQGKQTSAAIAAVEFGNLFGEKHNGLNCKISSWQRINSSILPPGAKASGNYLNSILASQEADNSGYDEAILMTIDGHIAEGPGENIFTKWVWVQES
jgi:branched-chain amino acid aminotransferase